MEGSVVTKKVEDTIPNEKEYFVFLEEMVWYFCNFVMFFVRFQQNPQKGFETKLQRKTIQTSEKNDNEFKNPFCWFDLLSFHLFLLSFLFLINVTMTKKIKIVKRKEYTTKVKTFVTTSVCFLYITRHRVFVLLCWCLSAGCVHGRGCLYYYVDVYL